MTGGRVGELLSMAINLLWKQISQCFHVWNKVNICAPVYLCLSVLLCLIQNWGDIFCSCGSLLFYLFVRLLLALCSVTFLAISLTGLFLCLVCWDDSCYFIFLLVNELFFHRLNWNKRCWLRCNLHLFIAWVVIPYSALGHPLILDFLSPVHHLHVNSRSLHFLQRLFSAISSCLLCLVYKLTLR